MAEMSHFARARQQIRDNRMPPQLNAFSAIDYAGEITRHAKQEAFTKDGLYRRNPFSLERMVDGVYGMFAGITLGPYHNVVKRIALRPGDHVPHITVAFKNAVQSYVPEHKDALDNAVDEILKLPFPVREIMSIIPVEEELANAAVLLRDGKHGMSRRRAAVEFLLLAADAAEVPALFADPLTTHQAFEIHSNVIAQSLVDMAHDAFTNPRSPMRRHQALLASCINRVMQTTVENTTVLDSLRAQLTNLTTQQQLQEQAGNNKPGRRLREQIDQLREQIATLNKIITVATEAQRYSRR